jgi:hypothetical protein
MKLQVEGQHVRVRIGENELAQLLAGESVHASTRFARAFTMSCTLRLAAGDEAQFSGQPEAWVIELPAASVREHAQRLPTRDGLAFSIDGQEPGDVLELLFDVDVRDSVRQRRSR